MTCPCDTLRNQAPCRCASCSHQPARRRAICPDVFAAVIRQAQEPLTAILGFADLALDVEAPREEIRSCLTSIRAGAQQLHDTLALAASIIEFTGGGDRQPRVELSPWSPADICADAIAQIRSEQGPRACSITLDVSPDATPCILTDPLRLRRLIHGLIEEACGVPGVKRVHVAVVPATSCPCEQDNGTQIDFHVAADTEPTHPRPRDFIAERLAFALAESLGARLEISHAIDRTAAKVSQPWASLCLCDRGCSIDQEESVASHA